MNDRLFQVPYGLLVAYRNSATSLPWAAMMKASRLAWRHVSAGRAELCGDPIGPGEINRARGARRLRLHPLRQKNQNGLLVRGRDDDCGVNQVTPEESPQGTCKSLTGCI